ncbi:MAG: beta-galactosidase [Leptospiraceae bacterium]|nr:beta-galactosidase [Leptospiraceae bacterium]MCK6381347.1 beta-galactosidase [Leptospiraceae bacterium]NUM42250.1 beta-galactosidase [Leptospiraceae bacterium]
MIFGADYYPEQWTAKDWDEDILIMQNMGISSVRLGEFSWALIEPKEGKYDFSFFDKIIDKFKKRDMTVILGTPTATFPPWLFKKFPKIVQVSKDGVERVIGTRRQACFSSKEYLHAVENIVTEMAIHYGDNKTVIGWQIDNEPGHEGSDLSYSKTSAKNFRKWLEEKYGKISKLNDAWGNIFWGVLYNDFDEIPLPGNYVSSNFNPSMIQDFYRFNSEMLVNFIHLQAKILKKYTKNQFLTTNLFPSPFLAITDMAKLASKLDFISWDNYPVWGPQSEPFPHPFVSAMLEYARGLKNQNFTVMEQFSGIQGHDTLGYLPPPGQVGLWLMQSIAHGANKIYFFRFRTARFGQEQLCYGILDHDKSLTLRYKELKDTIQKIKIYAEDFIDEDVHAEVAVVHDIENARNFKHQPLSEGLKFSPVPFAQLGYDVEIATWFSGFNILNVNTHLIPANYSDLYQYKILALPLYSIVSEKFYEKIEDFVSNGGILILGYRSGIKDENLWMRDEIPPGKFKEMAGVEVRRFESVGNSKVKIKFKFLSGEVSKICEIVEPKTAKVIARYSDKNKFYTGSPVITVNSFGKGKVYYLGSSLSPETFVKFYYSVLKKSGLKPSYKGRYIEEVYRIGNENDYRILMNHSNKTRWTGFTRLKPFEFKIIPLRHKN